MIVQSRPEAVMPHALTLRGATPSDLRAVCRLNALLAADLAHDELDPDALEAGVGTLLADPALGRCWLAESAGGKVAGQLVLKTLFDEWAGGHYGWIDNVVVERRHRRRGVAAALLEFAKARARAERLPMLRLFVAEDNDAALRAYLGAGFAVKGKLLQFTS
ncbi:MAG: GNAT family N-acetyltransferase [Gemmataceae bacterium]